jgi:hypothetical protein
VSAKKEDMQIGNEMKFKKSAEAIIIEDTPWSLLILLWGGVLFAFIFILYMLFASIHASLLMLLILALASSVLLIVAVKISVKSKWHFDFVNKEMNWKQRGFFYHRAGIIQFSDIGKIIIQADSGIAPNSSRYRLAMTNKQGALSFTPYYHRDDSDFKTLTNIADQLNTKLGTNQFTKDDVIIDLLSRGKKFEAIMQARLLHGKSQKEAKIYVNGLSNLNE